MLLLSAKLDVGPSHLTSLPIDVEIVCIVYCDIFFLTRPRKLSSQLDEYEKELSPP